VHKKITCILNAGAGSGAAAAKRATLQELFVRHGAEVNIVPAARGADPVALAKAALRAGASLIIAAGGDGTVSAVAGAVAGSDAVMAVLPLGTLNHFAKDLGIPLDLPDAVATALEGEVVQVDVGEVNGRVFVNNSSLGLYPGLVLHREALQRAGHGKWTAFARAVLYVLWRYRPLRASVASTEATDSALTTPFVFIGNNRYDLDPKHLGERASLDAGMLWMCRAPEVDRSQLLRLAWQVLSGHHQDAELEQREGPQFQVHAGKRRVHVATDGEVAHMTSPLCYRIRPRALRVVVPRRA
jgi:diacylglycerol kinase family enzyme